MDCPANVTEFIKSFDYLLLQLNLKNDESIPITMYNRLFESITTAKKEHLVPRKGKCADVIKYIDKSNNVHYSSTTGEQLLRLLKDPKILGLIEAYDEVVKQHNNVSLPELHPDRSDEMVNSMKIVQLIKNGESLGITIKYTPDGHVYVARLISGGAAEKSGMVQIGDRILSINNTSVHCKEPTEIVSLLGAKEDGVITFNLMPTKLRKCLSIDQLRRVKFVRSMVDYDPGNDPNHPCPENGLSFSKGDILELINVKNRHWAEARHFHAAGSGSPTAWIVPTDEQLSLTELTPEIDVLMPEFKALEPVCQVPPKHFIRTLVLIGPSGVGRNELKKRLIHFKPNKYASTVPHTSRPPRPHEQNGMDYHFVNKKQMEEWLHMDLFIESGEYNGNIYGTLGKELLRIMSKGQTPIINAHPTALKTLRSSRFRPLIIFIGPPDLQTLRNTRLKKQSCKLKETDLEQMISGAVQLLKKYGHLFDARIVNDNLDSAFNAICNVLHTFETLPCWVPADWLNSEEIST